MIKLGLDKIQPNSLIPRKRIINEMGVPSSTFQRWTKEYENPLKTVKFKRGVYVRNEVWNDWLDRHSK